MKKIYIIISTVLIVTNGCEQKLTTQQLVEESIKSYILENIDNPDKYEPVSFDEIDTLYSSYTDNSIYKKYSSAKDSYEMDKRYYEEYKNDDVMGSYYYKEMKKSEKEYKKYENQADSIKQNFIPTIEYIICRHTFRSENKFGAIVKDTQLFYLNPEDLTIQKHL